MLNLKKCVQIPEMLLNNRKQVKLKSVSKDKVIENNEITSKICFL